MLKETKIKLRKILIGHEGIKNFPYIDKSGKITIGVGRSLTDRGISSAEAVSLLDDDIDYFYNKLLCVLPWYCALDEARQVVLIDICFNIGLHAFMELKDFLDALEVRDYSLAVVEILTTKWGRQNPFRAQKLANIIKSGELPEAFESDDSKN